MYERILRQMRILIRVRQYIMTVHAEDEMNDDQLTIFDIERAILNGEIVERQLDHVTGEWKYIVAGPTVAGDGINVVAKISVAERLVLITVFREG